ncbi:MAG: hypothetical protein KC549_10980 [Myxococcales bacterium]|nr:hypothetical protein [Myxococcales bacterium]MCB9545155.1 hypothetical protein [Myxococcales bacterium]
MSWLSPLLVLLLDLVGGPAGPDPKELEVMAQRALARVEKLRGQKLSKPLKMGVKDKEQITGFIQGRLKEEYGPEKVRGEGELLKLQGLLPTELDYGGFITRLLAEQVAGFYDHTRQELHIAAWLPIFLQEPVMAHEIFHAVQDQEWGGGKLIDSKVYTHDAVLAHAALLEGDATVVMFNYQQMELGVDITESPLGISAIAASLPMQMASPQFPVMAVAPDYLKQSLIFPYQQGLLFIGALRRGGMSWADVRKIYDDPPASTEQILHPERYHPTRDVPSAVTVPPLGWADYKRTWDGTAGEFHHRQILLSKLALTAAIAGAAGWDGDLTAVEEGPGGSVAYTLSTWDTAEDAAEFAKALKEAQALRPEPRGHLVMRQRDADLAYAFARDEGQATRAVDHLMQNGVVTRR